MNANENLRNPESSDIANLAAALVRGSIAAKPIYSVKDLSLLLGKSEDSIYKLSRQMPNPLPLRELTGTKRGKYIVHGEFMEWFERATRLVSGASKN